MQIGDPRCPTPFSGERVRRRCGSRTTGAGRPGNLAGNAGPRSTPVSRVIWPELSGDPAQIPREGADHDWSLRAAAACTAARPARGRGGHAASAVYGRTGRPPDRSRVRRTFPAPASRRRRRPHRDRQHHRCLPRAAGRTYEMISAIHDGTSHDDSPATRRVNTASRSAERAHAGCLPFQTASRPGTRSGRHIALRYKSSYKIRPIL